MLDNDHFEQYHENEILDIPTNGINTAQGSPTNKFMRIVNHMLYKKTKNTLSIKQLNDITNAVGGQLDDIGDDLDLPRTGKSDHLYRFLLKMRMANRTSTGTANEIIRIISNIFEISLTDVKVGNDYIFSADGTLSGNPKHVKVKNLPLEKIDHPEIVQLVIDELSNSLALGISLSEVEVTLKSENNIYVGSNFNPYWGLAVDIDDHILNYRDFDFNVQSGTGMDVTIFEDINIERR